MTLSQNQMDLIISSHKWVSVLNLTLKNVKITQVPFSSVELAFNSSFPSTNQKLAIKRMVPIFITLTVFAHLSTHRLLHVNVPRFLLHNWKGFIVN